MTAALGLSRIGHGTWEASSDWGPFDAETVAAAARTALDHGVNWIDTAEVYGSGGAERLVGRACGQLPVAFATKVAPRPPGSGYGTSDIRRAAEASLARLARDTIDLYQLHWPDPAIPLESTWRAMAELVDAGLVRAIGLSNFDWESIERCADIAPVASVQVQFSLLYRRHRELARRCGERGIAFLAYSPLACGLLSGTMTPGTEFAAGDWRGGLPGFPMYDALFDPQRLATAFPLIERLRPLARDAGLTLGQLAIAWVLHQPGVTSAIVGTRSAAHVAANAAAANAVLPADLLAAIEAALETHEVAPRS